MPRPFSSSEMERLGVRLTQKQGSPDPADLEQLLELLSAYSVALDGATERVREAIGFAPSARVKNTGTILEKLDRYGGSWLKSIHDLAGMRVVRSQTRAEQDALTEKILAVFAGESKAPKVIDRRAEPVQGYRAVHVVVYPDGFPIEIQIRTQMQHEWAEIFEKLADVLGRGIRYGEPVRNGVVDRAVKVGDALDELEAAGELDAEARAARAFLKEASEMLTALPQTVIAVADVIDMIERAERDKPPPWSDSEVVAAWLRVRQTLDKVQDAIDRIPSSSLPDFSAED